MAQTFGEGWAQGLQIANLMNQRRLDQSIDAAGKSVQEEMAKEKELKTQQDLAQQELFARANAPKQQETPSIYQQGDSLGLQGYQTGNKPIQTTVQTAPSGYQTRDTGTENDLSPGGLEYPSANPATEQTLVGNYGTTGYFKGEKPTLEDKSMMQKDQQRPFNGPQDQSVLDLAQVPANKPEATKEATSPKILDTLNNQVTAADRAKESYDYNMRVIQKLQQGGNARAALEYQNKVVTSELTLAQADHMKFTTTAALAKQVGSMADNALELIQQPGADVNKIYYDTMTRAKQDLGYTGKVEFSLDPRENIKTLQRLQKDALTTAEKSELGIKQAVATQKNVMDQAELAIKQDKLTLDKINTGIAMNKESREAATASFNRLAENVKLQFQALNSINSVMDEDYKKALKPSYDANLKALQQYSKTLNVPMPNIAVGTPGNTFAGTKPVPTAIPTPAATPASPNAQPVNNAFPADVLQEAGVNSEAGGYEPPVAKTPAQTAQEAKTRAATKENIKAQIDALQESTKSAPERGASATMRVAKAGYKATAKTVNEASKAISDWAVGKDQAEVKAKILELQKQLDSLK